MPVFEINFIKKLLLRAIKNKRATPRTGVQTHIIFWNVLKSSA